MNYREFANKKKNQPNNNSIDATSREHFNKEIQEPNKSNNIRNPERNTNGFRVFSLPKDKSTNQNVFSKELENKANIKVVRVQKNENYLNNPKKDHLKELFESKGSIYGQKNTHLRSVNTYSINESAYYPDLTPNVELVTKEMSENITNLVNSFSKGEIKADELKSKLLDKNINSNSTEVRFNYLNFFSF